MTEPLTLIAAKLTASLSDRTLSGLLLPFNEYGMTNRGKLRASEQSRLTLADGPIPLNVEHDPKRPIGKAVSITRTPEGLHATFTVLPTKAGDDALVEAAEGLRACLSIEMDSYTTRGGQLESGVVDAAALVVRPAFPSAKLAAAELDDVPDEGDDQVDQDQDDDPPPAAAQVVAADTVDETHAVTYPDGETVTTQTHTETTTTVTEPKEPTMAAATVQPGTLAASATTPKGKTSKSDLFRLLASYGTTRDDKLLAALADVVPANILGIEQDQYVGELWSGKAYSRKIIPLFNHADLSSFKITGWRWVTKPAVASYAGNKGAVPSAAIETEQVEINATRIAGAHDIDRKFRDFANAEFWAAYFAAMTESYARVSDAQVLTTLLSGATAVEAGVSPAGVPQGIVSIVDGVLAILNATDTLADSAIVATNLWREIALTRNEDALAYLNAAIGLEEGSLSSFRIRPSAALAADNVLVSCKSAATVHELGGEAPIRVEALDIAKGGVDEGVFGYLAVNIHDADGLALVTPNVP